jgi:uncharacterized protein
VAVTLAFLGLTVGAVLAVRRLELRTDFQDLLPEGQPSVLALRKIVERVGGVGTLNLAIESDDKQASKRFAEDLVAALRARLGHELQGIDYTTAPVRAFFRKNGALYLTPEDLRALDRSLAEAVRRAKLRANPLYMELDEDEDAPRQDPTAALRELEGRLKARAAAADRFPEGYYLGEKGRLLAIFLRPAGTALEIGAARHLTDEIQRIVDELQPRRYHPSLRVGFTGSVKSTVEEHETIAHDLAGTALLCITLVAAAVWLYFRRIRVLALLTVTLAAGATWAFGLAALTAGAINAQTAFLGSIIVGTGINYGILILARFLEERRRGQELSPALTVALGASLRPTLVAALATGIAFGGLGIAHMRSFAQFGLIGGLGIVICWVLSYTALPALLVLFERVPWLRLRVGDRRLQLA